MKDTPKQVREVANGKRVWTQLYIKEALARYADLLERLERPVSDEQLQSVSRTFDIRLGTIGALRVAIESYRKSLLGETE